MTRLIRWLLGILGVVLSATLVVTGVAWWAITTETGTRWLVGKAIDYADVDIELQGLTGTLWKGLRAGEIVYEDPDRHVSLTAIELALDWSETSIAQVGLARLAAQQLTYTTLSDPEPASEPLDLDIPALPLGILADTIELQQAVVDGTVVDGILVQQIAAEGLDLSAALARAAFGDIQLQVSDLDARLQSDIPLSTDFTWLLAHESWSGRGSVTGSLTRLDIEHELRGTYPLQSAGMVDLADIAMPVVDITSSFDKWRYENWTATGGQVRLVGTLADYRAELSVSITDDELLSAEVSGDLAGNENGLTAVDLSAITFDGVAQVTGTAQWAPALEADLAIVATNIDVSSLAGGYATRLDLDVQVTATGAENFFVDVRELAGTYRDHPVRAVGTLSRNGEQWRCQACDASIGDNRVQAGLAINNRQIRGMIDVQAPAVHQLHPDLAGKVQAEGTLRGSIDIPVLSGNASVRELVMPGWSIGSATLNTRSATLESVNADIAIEDVVGDGVAFGSGDFQISGRPDDMDVEFSWTLEGNSIQLAARVQREDEAIRGRVSSAEINQAETGAWTLLESVNFVLTPARTSVDGTRWSNGDAKLRTGPVVRTDGSLATEIELTRAPLDWLQRFAPDEVAVSGFVDAFLDLRQSSNEWNGRFEWQQQDTVLQVRLLDGDVFDLAVPTATARGRFAPTGATLRTRLEADGDIFVSLDATASELSRNAVLDGQLSARGQEWGWIAAFVPEIEEVVGLVEADFRVRGRADDPQLRGELRLSDGEIVLPAFNVPLKDIQARLTATSADSLVLTGSARAGDGNLQVSGSIDDVLSQDPQLKIEVRGNEATVLDWPDYQFVASPELVLSGEGNQFTVDGLVHLDRAEVAFRDLPEGAVSPSADVHVIGREEADVRVSRLSGAVEFTLSDSVHLQAFGLDTNVEGALRIELPPGREPRASGELTLVGGFIEMYGQRLDVERGTIVYNGPLDNPFLDIRVTRRSSGTDEDILVALEITGRAYAPESRLYSEPAMSESEILSYLVTGRPLGQASSVDGQLISDAAFSLGLRQAGIITNQVGRAIGLDELVFEGNDQESTALVAGMQVSNNLYARFRYGVFSRLGELLLRYSFSESVSVEVGAGEFQSIDAQYTIERD